MCTYFLPYLQWCIGIFSTLIYQMSYSKDIVDGCFKPSFWCCYLVFCYGHSSFSLQQDPTVDDGFVLKAMIMFETIWRYRKNVVFQDKQIHASSLVHVCIHTYLAYRSRLKLFTSSANETSALNFNDSFSLYSTKWILTIDEGVDMKASKLSRNIVF